MKCRAVFLLCAGLPCLLTAAGGAPTRTAAAAMPSGEGEDASLQRTVEIEGFYWNLSPAGQAQVGAEGIPGTRVDLEDDLGYGSAEGVAGARLTTGRIVQFHLAYFGLDMAARHRATRTVRFEDVEFPVSANVASSLDARFLLAAVRLRVGWGAVQGGLLGGGQFVDLDAAASAEGYGEGAAQASAGMPVLGGFLDVRPFRLLRLRAAITGGDWGIEGVAARFLDAEATALLCGPAGFFAGAGYRRIEVEGDDPESQISADLTFAGPLVCAGWAWNW